MYEGRRKEGGRRWRGMLKEQRNWMGNKMGAGETGVKRENGEVAGGPDFKDWNKNQTQGWNRGAWSHRDENRTIRRGAKWINAPKEVMSRKTKTGFWFRAWTAVGVDAHMKKQTRTHYNRSKTVKLLDFPPPWGKCATYTEFYKIRAHTLGGSSQKIKFREKV